MRLQAVEKLGLFFYKISGVVILMDELMSGNHVDTKICFGADAAYGVHSLSMKMPDFF